METITNILSYFSITILLIGVFSASLKIIHGFGAQLRIGKLKEINRRPGETLVHDIRIKSEKEFISQSPKSYVSRGLINQWFDGIIISDVTDVRDMDNILRAIGAVRKRKEANS